MKWTLNNNLGDSSLKWTLTNHLGDFDLKWTLKHLWWNHLGDFGLKWTFKKHSLAGDIFLYDEWLNFFKIICAVRALHLKKICPPMLVPLGMCWSWHGTTRTAHISKDLHLWSTFPAARRTMQRRIQYYFVSGLLFVFVSFRKCWIGFKWVSDVIPEQLRQKLD